MFSTNKVTLLILEILLIVFVSNVQSNVIDQVYDSCNKPEALRLDLECIGFPVTDRECLARRDCSMVAMFQVIPSINNDHYHDRVNLTLVGTRLSDLSHHEMSAVLDAAFKPTYHPGEGTYYNCSYSRSERDVATAVKNPGSFVHSTGEGDIKEDLLICSWTFGKADSAWPTNRAGVKLDLLTRKIEIILYKDSSRSPILDTRLPIYKSRYLYRDCDRPDTKYCLGSPYCVDSYHECHEVLVIKENELDDSYLDFTLYSFDLVPNSSYYDAMLFDANGGGFGVRCGKYSLTEYLILPEGGSQETGIALVTNKSVTIDADFDGLRCSWSMPKSFALGQPGRRIEFDTRNTKYQVKLRHSTNVYSEKAAVSLPGFNIDQALYKDCSGPIAGRPHRECFGLKPATGPLDNNCLETRDCKVFSVFQIDGDTSWAAFIAPELKLSLYAPRNLNQFINMSIALSTETDLSKATVYSCSYGEENNKTAFIEEPEQPRRLNGVVRSEHDWVHCQWIWRSNGTQWPTIGKVIPATSTSRGNIVDLVNQRPSIQLSIGDTKKLIPQQSVSLPIYKLRYIYQECGKNFTEQRCLGNDPDCVKHMNCSTLIHMREHLGREAIDFQVFLLEPFKKLELIYVDPEENQIKIECYHEEAFETGSRVKEFFKVRNGESKPITNHFIKYAESKSYKMAFSRCNWLQEKHFALDGFNINSEHNRFNVRLTVAGDEGVIAGYSWNKVEFVGFEGQLPPFKDAKGAASPNMMPGNWSGMLLQLIILLGLYFLS